MRTAFLRSLNEELVRNFGEGRCGDASVQRRPSCAFCNFGGGAVLSARENQAISQAN